MQEIEIEFKNMLIKSEYKQLLNHYFDVTKCHPIIQINEYFDTYGNDLTTNKIALRIRTIDDNKELTLKIPSTNQNQNIEINEMVQFDTLTHFEQLNDMMKQHLKQYEIEALSFCSLGKIKTTRYERELDNELLVLDHTEFPNFEDYELEFEVNHHDNGLKKFNALLNQHHIPVRKANPKIKRFMDHL